MVCLLLVLSILSVGWSVGDTFAEPRTEYKVKAAFLYHFVQFTEWPTHTFPEVNSRIRVCVYGENVFEGFLEKTLESRSVKGRQFDVIQDVTAGEIQHCHLVFVNRNVDLTPKAVQRTLEESRALLVGESEAFLDSGGMIQFYQAGTKIRFAINPDALERNGIRLSSKLLRLAKIVGAR